MSTTVFKSVIVIGRNDRDLITIARRQLKYNPAPWARLERARWYLYDQLKPLEAKWWDYKKGLCDWTEDDQWLYLHYYVPLCEWGFLTGRDNP